MNQHELLARRRAHTSRALSLSYAEPLTILRGEGTWLIDADDRRYLDCVNNVCHVGHSHPRVVAAAAEQMALLNTNTRYLSPLHEAYVERLVALFPEPLSVCFLVCSGSEANDLALRLARAATGRPDALVLDHAYHGNLTSLIELSPYKHNGPGGSGTPEHVHVAPAPDAFRGLERGADAGARYLERLVDVVARAERAGRPVGAFFAESLLGCAGQIVPPPGFLAGAFDAVRAAGGVCVADEVQVGFGRVGSHLWAFEAQGARPDIVTLGKPIGNGHPLAAVLTTPAIADAFANGMEYFNTFGGNPVSCAVGSAVLDVLEEERLQENARATGAWLLQRLEDLSTDHAALGQVRGMGLFLGLELVRDGSSREPAPEHAQRVVEAMKARGILLSTDGPEHNVIKLKPPLCFARAEAERVADALGEVL